MTNQLKLIIDGEPVPASRPRFSSQGGKKWGYTDKKYRIYKNGIKVLYWDKYHNKQLFKKGAPLIAHIRFYRRIQKGLSKAEYKRRANHGDIKLPVRTKENGDIEFDAEKAAIGLGIVDTSKGNIKVRWSRLNTYLGSAKSGAHVLKGDFITEPQFYKLAIKANNATAEKFQDWVTSEVLPSIRKYGAYMTDQKAYDITHNKNSLADLLLQAGEQLKWKDAQITEMKPKAIFADSVSTSHTTILIGDLAKILKGNGINIGARRLFQWMRDNGYLIKRKGADYNSPTQKSMNLGLFQIKESSHVNGDGVTVVTKTPKVTGKGQNYFVNKFLSENERLEA